jgi:hypothetical protein
LIEYKGLGTHVSSSPFFGHGYGVDSQETMKTWGSFSFFFAMNMIFLTFQIFHEHAFTFLICDMCLEITLDVHMK